MTMQVECDVSHLKSIFKDQRCWIVGSGPSLDTVDLSRISKELIVAVNASITLFHNAKQYQRVYWFFRDLRIIREIADKIENIRMWRVITHKRGSESMKNTFRLRQKNARIYLYKPETVIHQRTIIEDVLQILKYLEVSEVNLVGVDHTVVNGKPYAEPLKWKECHFFDSKRKDTLDKNFPIMAMVKAMKDILPQLQGMKIYNTSEVYPEPVFQFRSFQESCDANNA